MTKKIKFPLEMEKGVKVRTLEELKEHFSLEKILEYYLDGRLTTWLRNGNYENEAVQISNLDRNDEDFNKKLCDTLNTNYVSHHDINVIELEERLKKTSQIKMYTVDEDIIKNINSIAFSQEELDKLLCNDINTIYICGNEFTIPLDKENTSYIGINSPRKPGIKLTEKIDIDFDKKNISFINIHLTSQSEIKIMARKSREVTMDKKIKTSFNFKKLVATFDIRKNDYWYNKKIFLFKDLLIIYDRWSFNIININTKETLVSFEDIKPPFIVFKEQSIEGLSIYKNYLIIFWGQNENSTLQLFNLNHLKIEKDIDLPYDYNRNVTGNVFIDIYNDCIGLYQGLGVNYGVGSGYQKVICQYHKFPSLELLEVKYLNDEIKFYNFDNHGTTYEGDAFRFSPSIMNIQSTRNNYTCKGFLRKDDDSFLPWESFRNNKYGSIGIFTIINDKIFATNCN